MSWFSSADILSKVGMVIAGLIILLSIIGFGLKIQESRLKKQSDKENETLRTRLDEELKQKSESALELAKTVEEKQRPRSLSSEQKKFLLDKMRVFAGQKLELTEYGLSKESTNFCKEIGSVLSTAGWSIKSVGVMMGVESESGIFILISNTQDNVEAARVLANTLLSFGFANIKYSRVGNFLPVPLDNNVIGLFVGPK